MSFLPHEKQIAEYKATINRLENTAGELRAIAERERSLSEEARRQHTADVLRINSLETANNGLTELVEFQRGIIEQERESNKRLRETSGSIGSGLEDTIGSVESLIEDIQKR